jgi:hypothetical protein
MSEKRRSVPIMIEQLDCFGEFTKSSLLCAQHCVLRLRCVIEQDHNIRMEVLADLATAENMTITIQ